MAMKTSAVPQNAQLAARPRSNYALFLGDLSIFCCEKDIEDAFASYGEIVNVRIQRSKETSRALSYGFIEFSCETAAVTAMNEMNSFVLKGRPLRIRWAAKRNQPVKSENAALHTAATIFVKFASQTGIIVSEQLMREHFSVFGQILDATIRTITIDEAYNRSKGYGFVNFINDETQDGLSVAYKAAADLQNATVNGVNYRCEVGHKHQPNKQQQGGAADSDSVSMGAYSSGAASMAVSASSASRASFLPSISPKHGYYAQMGQQVGQQVPVHSGASVNSANSHSSSGPSSPHPASFYPVNPAAQQQVQQQQQMSSNASVHSVGSGSASGVYAPAYNTSPHSPHHPVSTIVSTISFVPTPGGGMPTMPNIYTQGQAGPSSQQGSGSVYSSPTHAQGHYTPAQQQYFQQQQQFLQQQQQQQYYAQQQQGHAGQYYAQQQGMYPQQQQQQQQHQQAAYYGAQQQQGAQGQQQQGGYYSAEQYPQQQAAAAAQAQAQQQYYAQGYYAHPGPMSVSGGSVGSHGRTARSSAAYEATTGAANANTSYLNEQTLSQQQQQGQIQGQQQAMRPRRVAGLAQPMNQNYMMSQQQAPYYGQQQGYMQPVEVAQPSNGRRSQRNVSNQSNISEITSATLNELDQGDDDDEEEEEEEEQEEENAGADADADQEQADRDEQDNEAAAANAAAMISGLRMDSADDASVRSPTNANAAATQHLKSTLQIQATTNQPINCKLSERRRRNVSGGSNTTEITAEMLYDLQQQEQRLEQEEEEEGTIEPPKSQPSSPTKGSARVAAAASNKPRSPAPGASPRTPRLSANKGECSPPPGGAARARESSTASIAPFTMSAQALDELQKQAEAADALSKDRRTKRSSSERSNQSDITAALAYMGLDNSSAEQQFRALEDEEDAASSAENSVSVCICGKALDASARQSAGSPYASSCPYGTSACSCVYKATY